MTQTTTDPRVAAVFKALQTSLTETELPYLVREFAYVGNLSAKAEGAADEAELERKNAYATEYTRIKSGEEKVTDAFAVAQAELLTYDYKKAEVRAKADFKKLRALADSIEQAINAIKFLGRHGGGEVSFVGRQVQKS